MSGRRGLDGVATPHPLGPRLPAMFQPVLSREEAAAVRAAAAGGAAPADREAAAAAHAKLGLLEPTAEEALARVGEDDFLWRLCEAFDEVLAPVVLTLDTLDTMVDPALAPPDLLGWLGAWSALVDRTGWPEEGWRTLIAEAFSIYRRRGTAAALKRSVELYTEASVEVLDDGGLVGGDDAGAPGRLVVRIEGARRAADDEAFRRGVEAIVTAAKPVHVPHRIVWGAA